MDGLTRSPAPESEADYPTLSAHGAARRRFLKLCALSTAAAALGLELTGCPDSGGGGTGVTITPPPVPWTFQEEHLAGKMAMPMGAPVAVVVGGEAISVTFQDGVSMDLVVAAVVTPHQESADVKKDFCGMASEHMKAVQAVAKGHPSSVVTDAATVQAFEDALRDAINATLSGGYVSEVSVAKAEQPRALEEPAPARKAAPEKTSEEAKMMKMTAPEEKPKAAPTFSSQAPKAKRMWTPCRTPGCTSCGT